jgi:RNA polymerase sigma-70 factor (ECF subfamily)
VLPVNEPGDEALLQRTAAGDDAAFEALVRRFEQPLFRFLRRVTGSPQTADDIRTWTYLRVYEKARQYRGGSARAWVFRIAWRGAVNALRRERGRRAERPWSLAGTELAAAPPVDAALDLREEGERLRQVLDAMDGRTRALLWLCAAERMPLEEAARVLRRPASTLRYQLNKALERARREMRSPLGVKIQLANRHELC